MQNKVYGHKIEFVCPPSASTRNLNALLDPINWRSYVTSNIDQLDPSKFILFLITFGQLIVPAKNIANAFTNIQKVWFQVNAYLN